MFNFKLRDFLTQINKCKEKDQPISYSGIGFGSCKYAKLVEDEQRLKQSK